MNSKGMIGLGTVVLMMVVWLLMLISTASADAHVQARAYVACGVDSFRPSHRCYIGDAPHAVFRDRVHLSRRYKVCLRGPGVRFCVRARQRGGRRSQVNLLRFRERIGTYTVKWFVPGRRGSVRTWRFYFARGD
jgi:hypothetical protein